MDIGPAMTTKILTQNGQVLHRSTHKPLTLDELSDQEGHVALEQFMISVHVKLGSWIIPRDLGDIGLEKFPQYCTHKDNTQNKQKEDEIPMSEVADNYLGAEILLPQGNQMAMGIEVSQKRDGNGNTMGKAHVNPTLNMIVGGTKLAANVVAESM